MTRAIFLGKPIYMLLWLAVIGVLAGVGDMQMHLSFFNAFNFVVLALAMAAVNIVVVALARGDNIIPEPFDED